MTKADGDRGSVIPIKERKIKKTYEWFKKYSYQAWFDH